MQDRAIPLRSIDAVDSVGHAENDQFNAINSIGQFQNIALVQNNKIIPVLSGEEILEKVAVQKLEEKVAATVAAKSEVEVFFTKDEELLRQYYELRHYAYNQENGWQGYNGMENEFDRQGMIVVATQCGKVVGGMRLMFSDETSIMSNEIPDTKYNYRDIMTKYDKRENLIFSEISAIVVAKQNRDRSVTTKMFDLLLRESKKHQCNYMFGVAVAVVCREYRMIFKTLGHDVEIVMNYLWQQREAYNFVRMFPMYTKFQ